MNTSTKAKRITKRELLFINNIIKALLHATNRDTSITKYIDNCEVLLSTNIVKDCITDVVSISEWKKVGLENIIELLNSIYPVTPEYTDNVVFIRLRVR